MLWNMNAEIQKDMQASKYKVIIYSFNGDLRCHANKRSSNTPKTKAAHMLSELLAQKENVTSDITSHYATTRRSVFLCIRGLQILKTMRTGHETVDFIPAHFLLWGFRFSASRQFMMKNISVRFHKAIFWTFPRRLSTKLELLKPRQKLFNTVLSLYYSSDLKAK